MEKDLKKGEDQVSVPSVTERLRVHFDRLAKRIISVFNSNKEIEDKILDDMERNQSGSHVCGT